MSNWRATIVSQLLELSQDNLRKRGHVMQAFERLPQEPVDSNRRPDIWHSRCMRCNLHAEINEGVSHFETPVAYGMALAVNCIGR